MAAKREWTVLFLPLSVVGMFAAVTGAALLAEADRPQTEQGYLSDAQTACESFVKKAVQAPPTAQFESVSASPSGPDQYRVVGVVDGTRISCSVKFVGSHKWKLISLTSLNTR